MRFLSVRQAAEALGVSENTIRTWIDKKFLHAVQVAPPSALRTRAEAIRGRRI